MYFKGLNYTLANEDTFVERELLSDSASIIVVAGSGARVLPLLKSTVQKVNVIDISVNQLRLARLRYQATLALSVENFQLLLGYQPCLFRKDLFSQLFLPAEDQKFWISLEDYWVSNGFIFLGRWENHLRQLGIIFRKISGLSFKALFELSTQADRQEWMNQHWPRKRLKVFLYCFANPLIFNLILYRGHFARGDESFPHFIMRTFEKMLVQKDPRESFFMQILFLGDLKYAQGFPAEAQSAVYQETKQFQGEIHFIETDLIHHIQKESADFVSLSDVISYLNPLQMSELEQSLKKAFQNSESRWVARSFLKHPRWSPDSQKWLNASKCRWAEDYDKTGVYNFHIFENLGS